MPHRPLFLLGLAVGLALLAVGSLAAANAVDHSAGAIHACTRKGGALRVVAVNASCKKTERSLTWNVAGAQGERGPAGAAGAAGPAGQNGGRGATGPAGSAGAHGATGATGPQGAAGPQGPAGAQGVPGPEGPHGAEGAQGAQGPKGDPGTGVAALEDLAGVACHAGGQTGSIAVSYDASARAVLTCSVGGGGGGGGDTSGVRLNEFSTGVTSALTDEFIELYNAGSTAEAVGGFKVVYRSATGSSDTSVATIPAGTTIAAGAFYLLGGAGYSGTRVADQSFSVGLASTGGSLGLKDATGALVDAVAYGTAANGLGEGSPAAAPPTTASPGASDVRLPDGDDSDSNSADFSVSSTPTPGAANHS